jgi:alkanesulfonate monooxygenase SsuD/methylene tetrahydromethanopterin reductase-like flavin-dependent oxidoreductase (luciferase family)
MISSIGIAIDPDAPFGELVRRVRTAEQVGFDAVYVPDHSRSWRREPQRGDLWFDAVVVLSAFASSTSRIQLGTLVTNPILRRPDLVVREALALDHLSSGRFQLGIGTGIARFDHEATGTDYWNMRERLERFRAFVAYVQGALSSVDGTFTSTGAFSGTITGLPLPIRSPRPPLCVAGASKVVRQVAVEMADCWNTHGAFGVAADALPAHLRELNEDVTRRCDDAGREPASLRRSVLLFDSLSPWSRRGRLEELMEEAGELGFDEAVVFWPWDDAQREVFEHDAAVAGRLRRPSIG